MKRQVIGLLIILVVGINAESAQPWWLPHVLIVLVCLLIAISAYCATIKSGAHF